MHVVIADDADPYATRLAVKRVLHDRHDIAHSTIEVETGTSGCADPVAGKGH